MGREYTRNEGMKGWRNGEQEREAGNTMDGKGIWDKGWKEIKI